MALNTLNFSISSGVNLFDHLTQLARHSAVTPAFPTISSHVAAAFGVVTLCAAAYGVYQRPWRLAVCAGAAAVAVHITPTVITIVEVCGPRGCETTTSILGNSVLYITGMLFISAIGEEVIKRHRWVVPIICAHESLMYGDGAYTAIARFCGHSATSFLPTDLGIIIHALWNAFALTRVFIRTETEVNGHVLTQVITPSTYFASGRPTAAGVCVGVAIAALAVMHLPAVKSMLRDRLAEWCRVVPLHDVNTARDVFRDLPVVEQRAHSRNPHQKAAALRKTAMAHALDVASMFGRTPFIYGIAPRDSKLGFTGIKHYNVASDYRHAIVDAEYDGQVQVMCDEEYYLDHDPLARILTRAPATVIATVQPKLAAYNSDGVAAFFDKDGLFHYRVSGGGGAAASGYAHRVWDYQVSQLVVDNPADPWHGELWPSTTVYTVERKTLDDNLHEIVMLFKTAHAPWPINRLLGWADNLKHFAPTGEYTFIERMSHDERPARVSIARAGSAGAHVVDISAEEFDNLRSLTIIDTAKYIHTFRSHVKCLSDADAALLLCYFKQDGGNKMIAYQNAVITIARRVAGEPFVPGKASVRPFMLPLVHRGINIMVDRGNEIKTIHDRILTPSGYLEARTVVPSKWLRHLDFFADALALRIGMIAPFDTPGVLVKQNRPSQRAINSIALQLGEVRYRPAKATMHAKKEAAAKPTAALRAITEDEQHSKLQLAAFVYALHERVEKIPCFGFGKSMEQIAHRVAMTTRRGKSTAGDFSKLDATKATLSVLLFVTVMQRILSPADYARFVYIVVSYTGAKVVAPLTRLIYELFFQQGSGRMNTIVDNSFTTAFVAFVTYDEEFSDMQRAAELVFDVGNYTGDDSLDHVDADLLIRVGAELGFRIEAEFCGENYVTPANFLARIYPVDGSPESFTDIARALAKAHLTKQQFDDTPLDRLRLLGEKASSWLLNDSNTLVVGDLARAVSRVFSELGLPMPVETGWRAPGQWPNLVSKQDARAYANLEAYAFDFGAFTRWVERVNAAPASEAVELLLSPPCCVPPLAPNPLAGELFMLDGEYFMGEGEPAIVAMDAPGGKVVTAERQVPPPGAASLDAALVVSSEGASVISAYAAAGAESDVSDDDRGARSTETSSASGSSSRDDVALDDVDDDDRVFDFSEERVIPAAADRRTAAKSVSDAFRDAGVKMRDAPKAVKKAFAIITHGHDALFWTEKYGERVVIRVTARDEQ